ncbi:MAG: right-handed parallel beta-helix repeat-containing protein [Gammaproteobacteria bacterium]|nr:right-handed parallel beta-helix repeat-containing protein [Gammaproteobacteria bacterium]MDE0368212.1 right-handed parallel beta-helix repeat-containing protein [Gammaproteobacteria bacterium]
MEKARYLIALALPWLALGCEPGGEATAPDAGRFEDAFRLQLETAVPGDIIDVPRGVFHFKRGLSLTADGVTIRGAGMDRTVLNFAGQVAGAEGLLVTGSDFTIEDLAIEDAVGDALKINGGRNIAVRRVRAEWTNGPATENGAYGIYPVQTENTLIEDSIAIGASDAGLYVGQSRNVIVRNSRAEYNVAGIEIENTVHADVHGNTAVNNTGGILVFNMPDLPEEGHSTRVFDNDVMGNNTPNFGVPGTAVASIPAGSGVVINANDRVEIFDNRITGHRTANVLISSYFSTNYVGQRKELEVFDPFPETIYIYGNTFGPGGDAPDMEDLEAVRLALYGAGGRFPDIVWDGVRNPEKSAAEYAICVDNGDAEVLDLDGGNGYANPGSDMSLHACSHEKLAAVDLAST